MQLEFKDQRFKARQQSTMESVTKVLLGAKTFAQLALSGSTIWSLRFLVKCLLALIYQINFIVL